MIKKIEGIFIYVVVILFLLAIGYKFYQNLKQEEVIRNSHEDITYIKDSTLNMANQFIEQVKIEKEEKDQQIDSLKNENKKVKEKIKKINSSPIVNEVRVPVYKEEVNIVSKDSVVTTIHIIRDTSIIKDTIRVLVEDTIPVTKKKKWKKFSK